MIKRVKYPIMVRVHYFNNPNHRLVAENRSMTVALNDPSSKGWLFKCDCGEDWVY